MRAQCLILRVARVHSRALRALGRGRGNRLENMEQRICADTARRSLHRVSCFCLFV